MTDARKATFHCHTKWSDGLCSIPELVRGAEEKGFDIIGITDHLAFHPTLRDLWWSIPEDQIDRYVEEVHQAAANSSVQVLCAVEIDFFPGNPREQLFLEAIAAAPFDYMIGSVHMLGEFPIDDKPTAWEPLDQDQIDQVYLDYYRNMRSMAQTGLFAFAGHLDLPKKFGYQPTFDLTAEIDATIDTIAKAGMAIELNTAGWDKDCNECYPSIPVLEKCINKNIPVVVNDDAHCVADLGRHFDKAEQILNSLACKKRWQP